jgi:hypothetical protein
MRRTILVVVAVLATIAVPVRASAEVTIYNSDESMQVLATFQKASCRLNKAGGPSKIRFSAFSLPKNTTWTFAVFISNFDWHGFGGDYPLMFGDQHTIAEVFGPGGPYSNEFPIPGTPPGTVGTGGIKFSPNGRKISIGAYGLPDEAFTSGVSIVGAAKCKYPRRR